MTQTTPERIECYCNKTYGADWNCSLCKGTGFIEASPITPEQKTLERSLMWKKADKCASIIFDKHWGDNHPAMRKLLTEAFQEMYTVGYKRGVLDGHGDLV